VNLRGSRVVRYFESGSTSTSKQRTTGSRVLGDKLEVGASLNY
jgi:hypothetical protein